MLAAILTTQQVFADDAGMPSDGKPCSVIAHACLAAGFVKGESETKGIWRDCMKPVILGKSVSGVSVNPAVAKACRVDKIKELKRELEELQKAQ